jgi:hypothetical protein
MAKLPPEFSELERFADKWCIVDEGDRWKARLASPMAELQDFYDTGLAHIDEALVYLDKFGCEDAPDDAVNLTRLLYSLITVSFTVECWGQPKIPDTGAADLTLVSSPAP